MAAESLYQKLKREQPEIFTEMVSWMADHTLEEAANHIAEKLQMDAKQMYYKMRVWKKQYNIGKPIEVVKAPIDKDYEKLTTDEITFLEKFKKNEISFEDAQRELAVRVLKKILLNPELLKVSDWLKSETIKLQREELSLKKEHMEKAWGLIFGKFDFPKLCPSCGYNLQPTIAAPVDALPVLEIVDDTKPLGDPGATAVQAS
jgi:hypothetical protein